MHIVRNDSIKFSSETKEIESVFLMNMIDICDIAFALDASDRRKRTSSLKSIIFDIT